jgi:hypothetical protein
VFPVGPYDVVVFAQGRHDPYADRFLSDVEMAEPANLPEAVRFRGLLLEPAQQAQLMVPVPALLRRYRRSGLSRRLCSLGFVDLFPGVVGRARQRAGLDVIETEGASDLSQLTKLVRRVVASYREVICGRPKVLAQRDDVDVAAPQILHAAYHLVPLLSHPENDARLGERLWSTQAPGIGQYRQCPAISAARACKAV